MAFDFKKEYKGNTAQWGQRASTDILPQSCSMKNGKYIQYSRIFHTFACAKISRRISLPHYAVLPKDFYLPKNKPQIVTVPPANYIAVRGKGDPNEEGGAYKAAVGVLYAIAYTIKMSKMGDHRIDGYFDFVVPPLEGFWWQEGLAGIDYSDKSTFNWISVIRIPDFVTKTDFDWAVAEAARKKKLDCSLAEFLTIDEDECVQIMHLGAFDDEPATVARMDEFVKANGYENDFSDTRLHHEIYLTDARKVAKDKWKTVIRHPVKKAQ